jgi:hypothetical protein
MLHKIKSRKLQQAKEKEIMQIQNEAKMLW